MRQRKSPTGSNTVIRLSTMAALGFALLTGNALAQQQQITVPPPPSTPVSPGVAPLRSQIQSPPPSRCLQVLAIGSTTAHPRALLSSPSGHPAPVTGPCTALSATLHP